MKTQVVVVHGGGSFIGIPRERLVEELKKKKVNLDHLRRRKDWKATLQEKLGTSYDVLSPKMPNPDEPRFDEWCAWFENVLSVLDPNPILVGHSLGGLFLLTYLSEHPLKRGVRGLCVVAAPFITHESDWKSSGFALKGDFSLLKRIPAVTLYHSKDDPVVPFTDLEKFSRAIPGVAVRVFNGRGHFIDDNAPEVADDIKKF